MGAGVVVGGEVGGASRVPLTGERRRLPFILRGGVGAEEGDRVGDVLGRGEGLERLVGVLLAHLRGEDRVDDDDVRGRRRLASRKRVGERQRPRLGRRLGRAVGGVGAVGLCACDEETRTKRPCSLARERVVEGAGGVDHGADQQVVEELVVVERSGRERLAALPAADQVQRGRRRGRSALERLRPAAARRPRRAGRRPARRPGPRRGRGRRRARRAGPGRGR